LIKSATGMLETSVSMVICAVAFGYNAGPCAVNEAVIWPRIPGFPIFFSAPVNGP